MSEEEQAAVEVLRQARGATINRVSWVETDEGQELTFHFTDQRKLKVEGVSIQSHGSLRVSVE